ncbi:hypothetical protein ACROYT_G042967 [Oculina patagonica]
MMMIKIVKQARALLALDDYCIFASRQRCGKVDLDLVPKQQDESEYGILVTDIVVERGGKRKPPTLCVAWPPELITPIKPRYRVKEGETVKLRCKFSGTDDSADNRTLTAWQKLPEGHYITDKYERFKMRNGRYLKIRKVKLEDQGTYVCIAYNQFGKIKREIQLIVQAANSSSISTSARKPAVTKPIPPTSALNITAREPPIVSTTKRPPRKCNMRPSKIPLIDDSPPKFKNPFKNRNRFMEYVEGQQIKLKCHAQGAQPLNVTWLKNGKPLSRAGRAHLRSKAWVLNFAALTFNDAGTYTCIVRNAFCSIQRIFDVKVVGPPELITPIKPRYRVKEGETVTLRCKFSGTDDSADNRTLTAWRKLPEGHYITDKYERFKMRNRRYLRIRKLKLEDQGIYVCIAYNHLGKIKREIQHIVQASNSSSIRTPARKPAVTKPIPSTSGNHLYELFCP